ncbi:MAG: hypothetical protein K0R88_724 [Solirubrobacterales bacterium]|jgi:hypothetical protein|nr:hypothetical protein [Solirubrobacterales bacterium]
MSLERRIASVRKRLSESSGTAAGGPRTGARKGEGSGPDREAHGPGREMFVIPAQLWLAVAEIAGIAVLFGWRRALRPPLVAVLALIRAAYRLALSRVSPARAVTAVCLVAIASLAASQWLTYRGISVGTDAYSGGVEAVAPAPEIDRQAAGDAHYWVMLPLALTGLAVLARALTGLQFAAGAVLIATGLLLLRFLLPASAAWRAAAPDGTGPGPARRLLARAQGTLERGPLTEPGADAERRVKGKRGMSGASP